MSSPIRLDFGHFRVGINVVHGSVRFQSGFLSNDTGPLWHFSEKPPDTTCLVELAKVQIRGIRHNGYSVPEWVHQQVYLNPYPKELMLRNRV